MRAMIIILVAGLAVAACNRGSESSQSDAATAAFNRAYEDGFRRSFRQAGIDGCVHSAETRARAQGGAPAISFQAACTCFIDRVMAGKSPAELAGLRPGPREQAAMEQCARELGAR